MAACRIRLSDIASDSGSSGIRDVFDKAASIPDLICLAIGDPDLTVPDPVKTYLNWAIRLNQTGYTQTEGMSELRALILDQYSQYDFAENTIITCGVSGAIDLLCRVLFQTGRKVVVLEPYFLMYVNQLRSVGATPIIVPMTPDCRINLAGIRKAIRDENAVAIFVNSPNNPSGQVYSEEEIRSIAEIANQYGAMVISDDIYDSLAFDGEVPNFMGKAEHLISLNGFSKSHSLTGLRIGYAVGPKLITDAMARAQQSSYVCASSIAQWAISRSWGQVNLTKRRDIYRERRDLVWEMLHPHFSMPKPEGAFYAFVQMPPGVTGKEFADACLQQKVLVVPSGGTFTVQDTHVRVAYTKPINELKPGLEGMIAAKASLVR